MKLLHLYIENKVNYLFLRNLKDPGITNTTLYQVNFTVLKRYPQIFKKKLKILKKNLVKRVVAQFNKNTYNNNETNGEDEMIIPPQLFEIPKKILF